MKTIKIKTLKHIVIIVLLLVILSIFIICKYVFNISFSTPEKVYYEPDVEQTN